MKKFIYGIINMSDHCSHCKRKTPDINPLIETTARGRYLRKSTCGVCGARKSAFVAGRAGVSQPGVPVPVRAVVRRVSSKPAGQPRAKKGEGLLGDVMGMFGGGVAGRHTLGTRRSKKELAGEGLFSFIPGIGSTLDKLGNSAVDLGVKVAPQIALKALMGGGMKGQRRR